MTPFLLTLLTTLLTYTIYTYILHPLYLSPLSRLPTPITTLLKFLPLKLHALTKHRLSLTDLSAHRSSTLHTLHTTLGPVIRIGPSEVHFNSLTALRTIYGAGSGFQRTSFYRMFDVYGVANLFTFASARDHGERKKLVANAYSKSALMKPGNVEMVRGKVRGVLAYLERKGQKGVEDEVFTSLHYFSIDAITEFVYGRGGATRALDGVEAHRALLGDILHPSRRRLAWFVVHFPRLTRWMYSRVGVLGRVMGPLLPMKKPATYSGIREYALEAWKRFKARAVDGTADVGDQSIISLLFKHHVSQGGKLGDLDIASECADHLLAGIDTTADSLMFLIWALSLPRNRVYQEKLVRELRNAPESIFDEHGVPSVEAVDKLEYLNAVIKETLRLYAPLPATEPRSLPTDSVIDGYLIPAHTTVGMSPFSLHRKAEVFTDPLKFDPDRWLTKDANLAEMNKWFWAFSSGGRMCIGMHLAMAEMTTLVAAVYRKYNTSITPGFEDTTPAITSRFELFYDETTPHIKEHECWINFNPNSP